MSKTKLTQLIDEGIAEDQQSPEKIPHKAVIVNPMTDGNEDLREDEPEGEKEIITRSSVTSGMTIGIATGIRHVTVGDRQFKFTRRDPFGFWYISTSKGRLPDSLTGVYTSVSEAEKAVTTYVNNLK